MTRGLLTTAVASVALALVLALAVTRTGPFHPDGRSTRGSTLPADGSVVTAGGFLNRYLADDGRVVRRDQGGDTVSEGQAYALLIALGSDDRATFGLVWRWTEQHLQRADGLLSWHWSHGRVQDASSASDADLDAARALVVAGRRYDEPTWTRDGLRLGTAILDHETVVTARGRVLTAGSWVTSAPYAVNPSYVSPAAMRVLAEISKDPRWAELADGSRDVLHALAPENHLPPDWALVQADGSATPASGPGGQAVVFGYDAARTVIRNAESCAASDRAWAARIGSLLHGSSTKAVYDLGGSPQTEQESPVGVVSAAAADAAGRSRSQAFDVLRAADRIGASGPTYYGDAWAVLGRMLLTDPVLGGCPPLARGGTA